MPGTHHFRALTILILFLSATCSTAACGLVLPSNAPAAPVAPSALPQASPSPSATRQLPATSTAIPATATPDPSFAGTSLTFENDVAPHITELLQSGVPAPAGFQMPGPDQRQIVLMPNDARLYYLQTLLSPQIKDGGGPDAPIKLYVIYWYERGHDLYFQDNALFPASQTLTVHVQLVGEVYGHTYTFAGFSNDSADGSTDTGDMLRNTVLPLPVLGQQAPEVESAIELITGYGMGLDWDPTIPPVLRVDMLRPALQSQNWSDRFEAAHSLQKLGPAAAQAVPELIKAMELEEDQFVAAQAMLQALAVLQPAVLPLELNQNSANPLNDILSNQDNIPILSSALTAADWQKRALAAVILSRGGSNAIQAVPALMALVHDPNPQVRSAVISALGQLGGNIDAVVPALIQAQSDDSVEVRLSANRIFRYDRGQAQTVVPALIHALGDPDNTVRLTAIQSLQWLGRDAGLAIPPLIAVLKDPDAGIRQAASQALFYITNQGSGDDAASWRNWWQQQINKTTTPQPTQTYTGTF